MLYTKEEIEKDLVFRDKEDKFYYEEWKDTKEQRTKAQNNTFYRCFDIISKKMGVSPEEVKMNCLKALFWITTSKFWGVTYENAIKPRTSELNKEEAILLIDSLIEFWKKLGCWVIVTPRELQELFYNYE